MQESMTKQALVSIITPGYNEEKNIHRLLDSILLQNYNAIEFVFVDDGSIDNTRQVVEGYRDRFTDKGYTLKYYYQENAGQAAAINVGLQHFTGEYITWIDADDFLDKTSISKRVSVLEESGEGHFVMTQARFVDEKDVTKVLSIQKRNKPRGKDNYIKDLILEINILWASGGGTMVSTKAFKQAIPKNEIYPSIEGQNFQLIAPLAYYYKCVYIEESLYSVVCRSNSHSRAYRDLSLLIQRFKNAEKLKIETIRALQTIYEKEYIELIQLVCLSNIGRFAFQDNNIGIFENSFRKYMEYVNDIYTLLQDENSKKIYYAGMEYNMTHDVESLAKLIALSTSNVLNELKKLENNILTMQIEDGETVVVYGAGSRGQSLYRFLKRRFPKANYIFCDRQYEILEDVHKHKVISPDELLSNYISNKVILPLASYSGEVKQFLINSEFPIQGIYELDGSIIDEDMFLAKDIIVLDANEIVLEIDSNDNEVIVKLNNEELSKGIKPERIDEISGLQPPTLMKLDVGGEELNVLKGARETIINYKPKLAICIHHKSTNLWEIPRYIRELDGEYKFYIRHHSSGERNTVFYAVT